MTRGIRLTGFVALALLATLVVFLSVDDTHATPPPFDPGGIICIEDFGSGPECDGDMAAGAASDIRTKFCIAWNADCSTRDATVDSSNSGGLAGFTPAEWTLPEGDTIPIGAIAGRLDSEAWLGLLNNSCNNRIQVAFTMMNASINPADTIPPRPPGKSDVMQPLAMDASGNGIPDGADQYPAFLAEFFEAGGAPIAPRARLFGISNIQGSWVALNFLFFEPGTTLELGQTVVTFTKSLGYPSITVLQDPTSQAAPGAITDFCAPLFTQTMALGKTINNPCTPTKVAGANCPVTSDEAPDVKELGYPAFPCDVRSKFDDDGDTKINDGCPQVNTIPETGAECDNDISDDTEDSSINDGCPAFGDVSESARIPGSCSGGDEGGCIHRSNPATGGAYTSTILALSQRDADGDGFENSLDSCVYVYNPEWNPRASDPVNDSDSDGLPNVCDPKPEETSPSSPLSCESGYTGSDHDQDCFANRADNCPTDVSLQDPSQPPDPTTNKPFAPDDDSDQIGNVCDHNPNAVDGENTGYCLKFPINIGGAAGPVVGTKDEVLAPHCAARIDVTPVVATQTLPPGVTPRASGSSSGGGGGGGTGGGGGVDGGPVSGVGSLSPAGTEFPVWAAILAGLGAIGVLSGLTLLSRLAPRRGRR